MAQFFTAARLAHPEVPWETVPAAQARHLQSEYCGEELSDVARWDLGPSSRIGEPARDDPNGKGRTPARNDSYVVSLSNELNGGPAEPTSGKRGRVTATRHPWIPAARIETPRPFASP